MRPWLPPLLVLFESHILEKIELVLYSNSYCVAFDTRAELESLI